MNIVYFYQYFGTPKGSWSTRVYELTKRWVAEGNNVTVVTAPYEKSDIKATRFIEKLNIDGINLIIINSKDSNRDPVYKRALSALLFSIISIYYSLKLPCDVVIASSGPITIGIPGLFAKWFRGKKVIFEVRDLWPQGAVELGKIKSKTLIKVGRWFEKLCYKNADLIIPCSKGMEEGVLSVLPGAKTLTIPNASDPKLFHQHQITPDNLPQDLVGKKIFLYAGSLGIMDECAQIIGGMGLVKNDNIAMVIAGDGADREHLHSLADECPNKNIYFLGLLPKFEVVKWFSIATATFVTFRNLKVLHASSPNKMFDSFAAGKPIIQSTKGWIKDLVDKEKCGINVDPDMPQEFADAMELLAGNELTRQEMSLNAERLSLTIFNRDVLADLYLSAIKDLIND